MTDRDDNVLEIPQWLHWRPKGGMCAGCQWQKADCSGLPFRDMPVIETDGGVRIVRCTNYVRKK